MLVSPDSLDKINLSIKYFSSVSNASQYQWMPSSHFHFGIPFYKANTQLVERHRGTALMLPRLVFHNQRYFLFSNFLVTSNIDDSFQWCIDIHFTSADNRECETGALIWVFTSSDSISKLTAPLAMEAEPAVTVVPAEKAYGTANG